MKHPLHYILPAIISLIVFSSCEESDDNDVREQLKVSRTVLVYMAANNNPSLPHDLNFNAMLSAANKGALDNGGRLLVFRKTSYPKVEAQLVEITKNTVDILKTYPSDINSVAPEIMKEVIADIHDIAPAEEYGLLLWSHASGWRSPSRSWGQDVGFTGEEREMSIPDLADALGYHQFRFIYMDCCFMGNIETLYELRDAADYIIASSTETPYAGMDYERNIPEFFAEDIDFRKLVANTHEVVAGQQRDGDNCGIAISLYDMSRIENVSDAVKSIYTDYPSMPSDIYSIQQYGFMSWDGYFYDLYDYMSAICDDQTMLARLDMQLQQFVPISRATERIWQRYPLADICGVSSFIPGSSNLQTRYHYDDLKWYHDVVEPYFR
ncbi:MAG: hypothetical protein K2G79_00785 [Muribaculum sp.]|nr:hypothetical protein [Muribaculum sp.]